MRITRYDRDWPRARIYLNEALEVSAVAIRADEEEGWVDIQCPPAPKVTRYYGTVRIELEENTDDRTGTDEDDGGF